MVEGVKAIVRILREVLRTVGRSLRSWKRIPNGSAPKPVAEDIYAARVASEIEAYRALYERLGTQNGLHYTCPASWDLVEQHCARKIEEVTRLGDGYFGYVAQQINNHPDDEVHVLSLGAGTFGIEIDWICKRHQVTKAVFHGVDINGELLKRGEEEAAKQGIRVHGIVQDVNQLDLKGGKYHYILAYASLHHFMELEHIFAECRNHLLPGGEFITLDICTRNEYYMWEDSLKYLNAIFSTLPSKFKFNHTCYDKPTYEPQYVNRSFLGSGFECIRSEEIIPLLESIFERKHYVPLLCIGRRLFDHMFGYNFDIDNPLDRSIIDCVLNLDAHMIERSILRPETFFGAYVAGPTSDRQDSPAKSDWLSFRCNICGVVNEAKLAELTRERPSCRGCGSWLRMRSIIHLLSTELFGESLILPEFPFRPDIRGIGMSDWSGYAIPLAHKLNYKNTYYHKEPRLDITAVDPALEGTLDFLICSDVFEHVAPPISVAFENACKLLKPNGVFIFTAPYTKDGKTKEHFPDLHEYEIVKRDGEYILRNITKDGRKQVFKDLNFHGGLGATLEMRLFSEASLKEEFARAGFREVRIHGEPYLEYGIYWSHDSSLPMTARK